MNQNPPPTAPNPAPQSSGFSGGSGFSFGSRPAEPSPSTSNDPNLYSRTDPMKMTSIISDSSKEANPDSPAANLARRKWSGPIAEEAQAHAAAWRATQQIGRNHGGHSRAHSGEVRIGLHPNAPGGAGGFSSFNGASPIGSPSFNNGLNLHGSNLAAGRSRNGSPAVERDGERRFGNNGPGTQPQNGMLLSAPTPQNLPDHKRKRSEGHQIRSDSNPSFNGPFQYPQQPNSNPYPSDPRHQQQQQQAPYPNGGPSVHPPTSLDPPPPPSSTSSNASSGMGMGRPGVGPWDPNRPSQRQYEAEGDYQNANRMRSNSGSANYQQPNPMTSPSGVRSVSGGSASGRNPQTSPQAHHHHQHHHHHHGSPEIQPTRQGHHHHHRYSHSTAAPHQHPIDFDAERSRSRSHGPPLTEKEMQLRFAEENERKEIALERERERERRSRMGGEGGVGFRDHLAGGRQVENEGHHVGHPLHHQQQLPPPPLPMTNQFSPERERERERAYYPNQMTSPTLERNSRKDEAAHYPTNARPQIQGGDGYDPNIAHGHGHSSNSHHHHRHHHHHHHHPQQPEVHHHHPKDSNLVEGHRSLQSQPQPFEPAPISTSPSFHPNPTSPPPPPATVPKSPLYSEVKLSHDFNSGPQVNNLPVWEYLEKWKRIDRTLANAGGRPRTGTGGSVADSSIGNIVHSVMKKDQENEEKEVEIGGHVELQKKDENGTKSLKSELMESRRKRLEGGDGDSDMVDSNEQGKNASTSRSKNFSINSSDSTQIQAQKPGQENTNSDDKDSDSDGPSKKKLKSNDTSLPSVNRHMGSCRYDPLIQPLLPGQLLASNVGATIEVRIAGETLGPGVGVERMRMALLGRDEGQDEVTEEKVTEAKTKEGEEFSEEGSKKKLELELEAREKLKEEKERDWFRSKGRWRLGWRGREYIKSISPTSNNEMETSAMATSSAKLKLSESTSSNSSPPSVGSQSVPSPFESALNFWSLRPLVRRKLWGTDVYTDDSDVLAMCVHAGWLEPPSLLTRDGKEVPNWVPPGKPARKWLEWDGKEKEMEKQGADGKKEVNGNGNAPQGVSMKDVDSTSGQALPSSTSTTSTIKSDFERERPCDLSVMLRIAPALISYKGSQRAGINSRSWGNGHDGVSLYIESVELKEPGYASSSTSSRKSSKARMNHLTRLGILMDIPVTEVEGQKLQLDGSQRLVSLNSIAKSKIDESISSNSTLKEEQKKPFWELKM